jgi:protein-S-isoprenylcysteine O-methyltransferase Ste14
MFLLIKNILFTLFVPGTVAIYMPLRVVSRPPAVLSFDGRTSQLAALLPLLLGAAIYFCCLWDFAVNGRGTPAPIDAPKRLVVRGLYRYIRNPMYVGVRLVIAGWAVFLRSPQVLIYGASVGLLFHLFVILVEEPMLEGKFGGAYQKYHSEVGRWLPKARRRRAT